MKALILTIALSLPVFAAAKVSDFNALIKENSAEQTQLHKEVQTEVEAGRVALEANRDAQTVVEVSETPQHMPTNPNMLRFKKEVVRHDAKEKDSEKRLATEFKSADMEF